MLQAEGLLGSFLPDTRPRRSQKDEAKKTENRERRLARFEAVKQMQRQGLSISAIARKLGMHRATVRNFLRAETFPERTPASRRVGQITQYA